MKEKVDNFAMHYASSRTAKDNLYAKEMDKFFDSSIGSNIDKIRHFAKFVPRQEMSFFLAKNEIFKKILNIHGDIIECGVYLGGGLMTWANLSVIFEPFNHTRKIIGFDSFEGFPRIHDKDGPQSEISFKKEGGLKSNAEDDIRKAIELFDGNRPIDHITKVDLVVGDAVEQIPNFLIENAQTVVALLYLDFDAYEPTKVALETFLPRMPKGAVICFDELNDKNWPGETLAVLESLGIRNIKIERFNFTSNLSYAVLE